MTIAGIWENEYGSRMTLMVQGEAVSGIYDSTTGAIGRYIVCGWQSATDPTPDLGQPIALTIAWHSVADGPSDAGWHWTSTLGGQISIVNGEELLLASHLLVATTGFDGLCDRGVYVDKLTYRRVSGVLPHLEQIIPDAGEIANELAADWRASDGTELDVKVWLDASGRIGLVRGFLTLASERLDVAGFTDIDALGTKLGFQSVSIAAVNRARNLTLALGGWLDATGTLSFQSLTTHVTSSSNSWVQTTIRPIWFNCRSAL